MKQTTFKPVLFAACLSLVCATSAHAEIYKWVDANGKVHYSEKKDDAGKAKVEEVKVTTGEGKPSTAQSWQDQEIDFRKRQMEKQAKQAKEPVDKSKGPSPFVPGNQPETNESRCAMAKGILNGDLVHGNRIKIDANDKAIAQRDVSTYCR
ncbi:DUF4124 domain-containing protein [Undibacterium sp. Ji83W]|uniref:DUF4124 domain-containing protein n=1 Tax=Undibacterium sp. Ji83W TaxID=3413043 RepID=UPI003BF0F25B